MNTMFSARFSARRTSGVASRSMSPTSAEALLRGLRRWAIGTALPLSLLVSCSPTFVRADEDPASGDFFERRVRPVLIEHCAECHGAERQESDLRVDASTSLRSGGASGKPAVVPGDVDASLLAAAIEYRDGLEMPPDGRLDEAVIADLKAWIAAGATWPAASDQPEVLTSAEKLARQRGDHWALQPIVEPPAPAFDSADRWSRTPLDALVRRGIVERGLEPSPELDRARLIRRLKFDLLGLPADYDEVQAFVADERPDAYERQLDRYLASASYGERWARHWLDVARYADTRGYAFARDRRFPFAYTYRDYVIRAFDEDVPYDRFVKEQLAADSFDLGDEKWRLAALGFLTVGRRFNNHHDDIDDRIDVTFRGLMGLTVSCARCHDHKYDAVPTEDYYALYGVFASCDEPGELPSIADDEAIARNRPFFAEKERLEGEIESYVSQRHAEAETHARNEVRDYLIAARWGLPETADQPHPDIALANDRIKVQLRDRWKQWLDRIAAEDSPRGRLWQRAAAMPVDAPAEAWSALRDEIIAQANEADPPLAQALRDRPCGSVADVLERLAEPFVRGVARRDAAASREAAAGEGEVAAADGGSPSEAIDERTAAALDRWADELIGDGGFGRFDRNDRGSYLNRVDSEHLMGLQSNITAHLASAPSELGRAMVLVDHAQPMTPRVFLRGNPARPGDEVPRRFVSLLAGESPQPFAQGSGRRELAEAIAGSDNPLTPRVFVNRVWSHLFGAPIVDTMSDFGIRCESPPRQDVLDYLSRRFVDRGWSIKQLQRDVMRSTTYRQTSEGSPHLSEIDPENRLLARQNRRRAEFEALRDGVLYASGQLVPVRGGKSVDIFGDRIEPRRTVYATIDRQDLPNLLRTFDFASPDQHVARRPLTIVPQQALFLMNSRFAIASSSRLVDESERAVDPSLSEEERRRERLVWIVRRTLQRDPSAEELAGLESLVSESGAKGWRLVTQLLLETNEFAFVD